MKIESETLPKSRQLPYPPILRYSYAMTICILGYGSLIWDLDDLAPKVRGAWRMGAGPSLPLEFSRISPKRKLSLVVVIDTDAGDPCPTHVIDSARDSVAEAVTDLAARERTTPENIGWVDCRAGTAHSNRGGVTERVRDWCAGQGVDGAVWTDLDGNFEQVTGTPFTVERGIVYLKTLEGDSLAAAREYIDGAPVGTDTPLRRALRSHPWWHTG